MQCVEELSPEACLCVSARRQTLFDLDEIEALPAFDAPDFQAVAFGFAEAETSSATTCTVSVTLVTQNPYDGVLCYAQSPLGLDAFTRAQLETALGNVRWGQQVAFDSARLGVRPQDTPTASGQNLQFASPVNPGKDPVVRAFETTVSETVLATYAHVAGQLANSVDSLFLDKPGNFYNYWGMVEVWRHQRLIDKIQKQLNELPPVSPSQNPSGDVCK